MCLSMHAGRGLVPPSRDGAGVRFEHTGVRNESAPQSIVPLVGPEDKDPPAHLHPRPLPLRDASYQPKLKNVTDDHQRTAHQGHHQARRVRVHLVHSEELDALNVRLSDAEVAELMTLLLPVVRLGNKQVNHGDRVYKPYTPEFLRRPTWA